MPERLLPSWLSSAGADAPTAMAAWAPPTWSRNTQTAAAPNAMRVIRDSESAKGSINWVKEGGCRRLRARATRRACRHEWTSAANATTDTSAPPHAPRPIIASQLNSTPLTPHEQMCKQSMVPLGLSRQQMRYLGRAIFPSAARGTRSSDPLLAKHGQDVQHRPSPGTEALPASIRVQDRPGALVSVVGVTAVHFR